MGRQIYRRSREAELPMKRNHGTWKKIILSLFLLTLTACQKMEAGEHGVVFSALPTWAGGGVQHRVVRPGEVQMIFPWESVYRISTVDRSISWGSAQSGLSDVPDDYVETRALDGNEVGLAMTIQYAVDPERVRDIVQRFGPSSAAIDSVVASVARADIRTHMNVLRTRDFFSPEKRQDAVLQVKRAMEERLKSEGIVVRDVIYKDHRFERRIDDGTMDRSYQELIDRTQATNQETEQEEKKIASVIEQKKRELNDTQAKVNRVLEQVEGYRKQAELRGDAYLEAKKNEAEQVTAMGNAEVDGLRKQVEALRGPGGRALLRLAIVKKLLAGNPKFVLLNQSGAGTLDLNKLDANDIIREAGIFAVSPEMHSKGKKAPEEPAVEPVEAEKPSELEKNP